MRCKTTLGHILICFLTIYVIWFTVLSLIELTILMFLSVVETIDGLLLCGYCSGYFQVFNNRSFRSSHLYGTLRNCHNLNFQALTGRPFPTIPSANWESINYLYQICHLLSTFQIITQPHPAYNFVADMCEMGIKPGLPLSSFKVIVLFQREIE